VPALDQVVGASETDARRLDCPGREIERQDRADSEQSAARRDQQIVQLAGDRLGDDGGHAEKTGFATLSARLCEPTNPANAVTKMRNGNSEVSVDSAI
jgi:hypothetical protein